MGLDNYFVLKNRNDTNIYIELSYFRNFYELRDYAFRYGEKFSTSDYDKIFSEELLRKLYCEIKDIAEKLSAIPENTLIKYDEEGYPEELDDLWYGEDFSPSRSRSCFAGSKLLRLYRALQSMIDILEYNAEDGYYILLISSF